MEGLMPVSFLTEQQRNRYGRFSGELSPDQLTRYFHLDDRDRMLVNSHRGAHSRLGFAIQLCTARFLGTFLEDLSEVPPVVIDCLARQLQIEQLSYFFHYRDSETRWDHAAEIRRHCAFRDFGDPGAQFRLNRWLYALCWTGTDRPGVLFDRVTGGTQYRRGVAVFAWGPPVRGGFWSAARRKRSEALT
jgi:hypothetical protein